VGTGTLRGTDVTNHADQDWTTHVDSDIVNSLSVQEHTLSIASNSASPPCFTTTLYTWPHEQKLTDTKYKLTGKACCHFKICCF